MQVKVPGPSDFMKMYDRASDHLGKNPRTDVIFVLLLLLISISFSVSVGNYPVGFHLKFLLPIITVFCAASFGNQYRIHIALGTLPLMFGFDFLIAGTILFELGNAGLYFANLALHRFAASASFRRAVLGSRGIPTRFLLFITIGLFIYPDLDHLFSLVLTKDDADVSIALENFTLDPRTYLFIVFFLIGAAGLALRSLLWFVAALFLLSFMMQSTHGSDFPGTDLLLRYLFNYTYSDASFVIGLIAATQLGRVFRSNYRLPAPCPVFQWRFGGIILATMVLSYVSIGISLTQIVEAPFADPVPIASPDANDAPPLAPKPPTIDEAQLERPAVAQVKSVEETNNSELEAIVFVEEAISGEFYIFGASFDYRTSFVLPILLGLMLFVFGMTSKPSHVIWGFVAWFVSAHILQISFLNLFGESRVNWPFNNTMSLSLTPPNVVLDLGFLALHEAGRSIGLDYMFAIFGFALSEARRRSMIDLAGFRLFNLGQSPPSRIAVVIFGGTILVYVTLTLLNTAISTLIIAFGGISLLF